MDRAGEYSASIGSFPCIFFVKNDRNSSAAFGVICCIGMRGEFASIVCAFAILFAVDSVNLHSEMRRMNYVINDLMCTVVHAVFITFFLINRV